MLKQLLHQLQANQSQKILEVQYHLTPSFYSSGSDKIKKKLARKGHLTQELWKRPAEKNIAKVKLSCNNIRKHFQKERI